MLVAISEIKQRMREALKLRGVEGDEAEFIISDYVESELEGHKTHGLSKFLTIDAGLRKEAGPFTVIKKGSCYAKLDGNGSMGHIVALNAAKMCMEMVREYGIGMVAFQNVSRYSRVTPYARLMASNGFVGILTNNGGPACVVPFGGRKGILGTNPLCFGFPGKNSPYIFDFATSQKVWGAVRQAIVERQSLPEQCFVDEEGNFTTVPERAAAVIPFGGAKGYTLCYALEIMTGAFVGAKMGLESRDEFELGYLFTALSPEMFADLEEFENSVERLGNSVRSCPPVQGTGRVYVPGEIFGDTLASAREGTELDIDEDIYARLQKMSVSLDGGYENNKTMN